MSYTKMADVDLSGKRVLIREDLNVPIHGGLVTSDARIRAALPTLRKALAASIESLHQSMENESGMHAVPNTTDIPQKVPPAEVPKKEGGYKSKFINNGED